MNTSIEQKIVEMRFDNAQFERGVNTSLNTLEKLEDSLRLTEAGASLSKLSRIIENFDFGGLTSAIVGIERRFSLAGIVGMTIISEITRSALRGLESISYKITSMVKEGGIARAMNIEKAKFQLEGLKVAWDDIKEDIEYGVNDTAYGLDAAANVASQLVASGVTLGDNMKSALRGISGVAAMTNSTYEEIGSIFTTVAGQSKLMTMQLRQLEARGLNAAATLGNVLGKTEAEIREMVSDGEINFAMFSKAMDEAFGEHAKDANKTFNGVMSNVRSALSRIGAEFIQPLIENEGVLVNLLESLRKRINDIKSNIIPLAKAFVSIVTNVSDAIRSWLDQLSFNEGFRIFYEFLSSISTLIIHMLPVVRSLGTTFLNIFPKKTKKSISEISYAFHKFTSSFYLDSKTIQKISTVFGGLLSVIDILVKTFKSLVSPLSYLVVYLPTIANGILSVASAVGAALMALDKMLTESGFFIAISKKIETVLSTLMMQFVRFQKKALLSFNHAGSIATGVIQVIFDSLEYLLRTITLVIEDLTGLNFMEVTNHIVNFVEIVRKNVVNLAEALGKAKDKIVEALRNIRNSFSGFDVDLSGFEKFIGDLSKAVNPIEIIGTIIKTTFSIIEGILVSAGPTIVKIFGVVTESVSKFVDSLREALGGGNSGLAADIIRTSLLGWLALQIKSFIVGFKKNVIVLPNVVNNFSRACDEIAGALFNLGQKMKGDVIWSLAKSIGLISVSLLILTGIDSDKLATSLVALGSATALISNFAMKLIAMDVKKIAGIPMVIMSISTSILILSASIKMLSSMNLNEMIIGLGTVTALIFELSAMLAYFSVVESKVIAGISGLISLSIAIGILAIAVKALSSLSPEEAIVGLSALSVIIFELSAVLAYFSKVESKIISGATGLIALALAVRILANATAAFSKIEFSELLRGLASVITLLFVLTASVKSMSGVETKMVSIGTGLLLIGVAMNAFALSAKAFATLSWADLGLAFTAIASISFVLTALSTTVQPAKILAMSSALLIFSVAMNALAISAKVFGSMSWEEIAEAFVMISAISFVFSALSTATNPVQIIAFSAALVIFAAAINMLAVPIALLSAIKWQNLVASILAFVGVIGAFVAASVLLSPMIPVILAFGAALIPVGAALLLISGSVFLVAAGLTLLAGALAAFVGVSGSTLALLLASISEFLASITPTIDLIITSAIQTFFFSLVNAVKEILPILVEVFTGMIDELGSLIPKFIDFGVNLILGIVRGINDVIGLVAETGINIVINLIEAIISKLGLMIDAGTRLIIAFIDGLSDSIEKNAPRLIASVERLGFTIIATLVGAITGVASSEVIGEAGANVVRGFLGGIGKLIDNVKNKGIEIAKNFLGGLVSKEGLDEHSPSKATEEIAEYAVKGFTDGLSSSETDIFNSGVSFGNTAGQGLTQGLSPWINKALNALQGIFNATSPVDISKSNYVSSEAARQAFMQVAEGIDQGGFGTRSRAQVEATKKKINETTNSVKDLNNALDGSGKGKGGGGGGGSTKSSAENAKKAVIMSLEDIIEKYSFGEKSIMSFNLKFGSTLKQYMKEENILKASIGTIYKFSTRLYEAAGAGRTVEEQQQKINDAVKYLKGELTDVSEEVKTLAKGVTDASNLAQSEAEITSKVWEERIKGIKEAHDNLVNSIKSGLSSIDFFAEVSKEEDPLSGIELMKNMRDNLDKIEDWEGHVETLIGRFVSSTGSIPQELINKLASGGVSSMKYVDALLDLDEDELQEYMDMYTKSLTISDETANNIYASMAYAVEGIGEAITQKMTDGFDTDLPIDMATALGFDSATAAVTTLETTLDENIPGISEKATETGVNVGQGLVNGMAESIPLVKETATLVGEEATTGIAEGADTHSPSKATFDTGTFIMIGLKNGMESLRETINHLAYEMGSMVVETFRKALSYDTFYGIGVNVMLGLGEGIKSRVSEIAESIAEACDRITESAQDALGIASPSKVFYGIGEYLMEGLGNGVTDSQSYVMNSINKLSQNITESMNNNMDFNPTIRPVLDLSNVEKGARRVGNLFNASRAVSILNEDFQNDLEESAGNGRGNTFSFVQNNYSPKSLSRIDIYRQTKNQFAMMKGIVNGV